MANLFNVRIYETREDQKDEFFKVLGEAREKTGVKQMDLLVEQGRTAGLRVVAIIPIANEAAADALEPWMPRLATLVTLQQSLVMGLDSDRSLDPVRAKQ